ncbi:MAG TPA: dihydroorotate dehydrogenase-like protein, partial [Pirellulales bacterium]|nr:dihydroorotate dehydrogenase-like protein [Pirellulales bacterium]
MAVDLRTPYLGLTLGNPVVVSACPLTSEPDVALRLQELGAAALSLPSLFEEQLEQAEPSTVAPSFRMDAGKQDLSYYRALQHYNRGPQAYLRYLAESKQRLKIPVFASLNGTTAGAWVRYAAQIEDAGADALELNMYYVAADAHITGQQVE